MTATEGSDGWQRGLAAGDVYTGPCCDGVLRQRAATDESGGRVPGAVYRFPACTGCLHVPVDCMYRPAARTGPVDRTRQ